MKITALTLGLVLLGRSLALAAVIPRLGDAPTAPTPETVRRLRLAAPAIPNPSEAFSVDPSHRERARILFNTVYADGVNAALGWTGDLNTCAAGTTTTALQNKVAERINYFRAMAGVPAVIVLNSAWNDQDQQAALMMSANDTLSHFPPSSWTCYTPAGANAASNSNISLGEAGPDAISGYIRDSGGNNSVAGHRRWLLYPQTQTMGTGDVGPTGANPTANATWVMDGNYGSARPATRQPYVSWPPPGYVPYPVVYTRWSITYPNADFSGASVTMSTNGVPIPVTLETLATGYGENTLVWYPANLDPTALYHWPAPATDTTYNVTVQNVLLGGIPTNFNYAVTVFDPSAPGSDTVLPVVSGPAQPAVNVATSYNFVTVPTSTGYQWRQERRTLFTAVEGAENGLANVTTNTTPGYNLIVTDLVASGSHAFQLAMPVATDQIFTINRTFLVGATSQLHFQSLLGWATPSQFAIVEVSLNEGASWNPVYSQAGTGDSGESAYTVRSVSLASYAGRSILVRFRYAITPGGSYFYQTTTGVGWYLDDISFVNTEELTTPAVTPLGTTNSFSFTPSQAGDYALQVRAQVYSNYFLEWGPALNVTAPNTVDTTPPTLTVLSPTDYQAFTDAGLTVSGTASDASGIKGVAVNGAPASIAGGNWSATLTLAAGTNTFTVIATDNSASLNTTTQFVHAVLSPSPTNQGPVIVSALLVTNSLLQVGSRTVVVAGEPNGFDVGAAGDALQYQWSFGDGTSNDWSTTSLATHAYATNSCGAYPVTVSIRNSQATISSNLTVIVACQLSVTKLQATLAFAKPNSDKATLTATFDPAATPLGQSLTLDIGGAPVVFAVDGKGKGVGPFGSCKLTFRKASSKSPALWTLAATLSKGSWAVPWGSQGLVNATIKTPATVTLPVVVLVGDDSFAAERNLKYTATAGKSGTAK